MEQYKWETVLENLPSLCTFFLVGDKEKRENMVYNIEENFDGRVIHINCKSDMLDQIKDAVYDDLIKEEKDRLEDIFMECPSFIVVDSYFKHTDDRVMLIVDEVLPNKNIAILAHEYQMWLRHGSSVCMVMSGTEENVKATMNMDGITFLWRAYKIYTSEEVYLKMYPRRKNKSSL